MNYLTDESIHYLSLITTPEVCKECLTLPIKARCNEIKIPRGYLERFIDNLGCRLFEKEKFYLEKTSELFD